MSLVQMMSLLSTKSVSKLPLIRPAFIDRASKAHMDAIFEGATFLDRIDHVGSILLELFRSIEQSQIQGFFLPVYLNLYQSTPLIDT